MRSHEEATPTSLRIPVEILAWVKAESERRGGIAYATIINEALENVRTCFRTSPQNVALLDREQERLGLKNRYDHYQYILSDYLTKLVLQAHGQAPAAPPPVVSGTHKRK